jgi:hypothetical protein
MLKQNNNSYASFFISEVKALPYSLIKDKDLLGYLTGNHAKTDTTRVKLTL